MVEANKKDIEILRNLSKERGYPVTYAYYNLENDGILTCILCQVPIGHVGDLKVCPKCKGVVTSA